MKKIGIFCSASEHIDTRYAEAARALGEWMGAQGMTLVYGGCDLGLMEVLAKAVRHGGGHVLGVVPDIMETCGRTSTYADEVVPCHSLSERKDIMTREADIIVALPGGIGTLDEIFSVLASHTIGYHQKRVLLYNIGGFWDKLLQTLHTMDADGFFNVPFDKLISVANTLDEVKSVLK